MEFNDPYYTPHELAVLMKVKDLTIYRWIKEGRIQAVKVGQWRITADEMKRITSGAKLKPGTYDNT